MGNTIKHMFEGVRPFDWLMLGIEILVLVVIAFEWGQHLWEQRKAAQRRRKLNTITQMLSDFMFEGQTIRHETPNPHTGGDVMRWVGLVTDWQVRVSQYLAGISSRAESAFSLIVNSEQIGGHLLHQSGDAGGFYVTGYEGTHYRNLVAYLNNLRSIIEKLEVYF